MTAQIDLNFFHLQIQFQEKLQWEQEIFGRNCKLVEMSILSLYYALSDNKFLLSVLK